MTTASPSLPTGGSTLLLAADTPAELDRMLAAPDVARRPGAAAGSGGCRLGIVGPAAKNLALARRVVAKGRPWRGRNDVWFSPRPLLAEAGARIAFLFPGLEGEFAPNVADVAAALGAPVPALDTTSIGRHAAGALRVGRLLDTALRSMGITPDLVAGHSVGEWNAMSAGGMFSAAELDALITRCDLDVMAVPDVDFGVAGCAVERLAPILAAHPSVVISHENSTNQSVVCGPPPAVAAVLDTLRGQGVVCQVLPFRSGFHTPMLRPHLAYFRDGLAALPLRAQQLPVWSSTIGGPFPAGEADVRELCERHLVEPVRFRATVGGLYEHGARVFVQVGAGQLGSLVADTLRGVEQLTVAANSAHRSGLEQLRRVATAVWVEGGANDPLADPHGRPALAPRPAPGRRPTAAATPTAVAQPAAAPARVPVPGGSSAARELAALLGELQELAELAGGLLTGAGAQSRRHAPPAASPAAPAPSASGDVLHVSTRTMPYLLDHCFVPQREGWPDEADRRPVVPATTVITHLLAAAQQRLGGATPLGLDSLRLHRWMVATPPVDVPIDTGPAGPGRLHVRLGTYAEADVVVDEARTPQPAAWGPEPDEQPPALQPRELYAQRWLFHGERFQVVARSLALGPRSARAELHVTDVPGALLDGVGHVLGQWLVEQHDQMWLAFPVRVARLRTHAPLPPAGSRVECEVRVREVTDERIVADAQLRHDGRVLVSISGWTDHVFDCARSDNPTYRFPESGTLARQAGDRWVVRNRWRDLASRELWVHRYLTAAEVGAYRSRPPRDQRGWFLARVAVKDAVRAAMWAAGAGPLFPAELTVHGPDAGWCTVTGTHGMPVPDVAVAVAHTADLAVAQVHDAATARAWDPARGAPLTVPDQSADLSAVKELIR